MNVVKWMLARAEDYEEKARELRRAAKQLEGVRDERVPMETVKMRAAAGGGVSLAQTVLNACENEFKSAHDLATELNWPIRKVSNHVVRLKQRGLLLAAPKEGRMVYKKR